MNERITAHRVASMDSVVELRRKQADDRLNLALKRRAEAMRSAAIAHDQVIDAMRAARSTGVRWEVIAVAVGVGLVPVTADGNGSGENGDAQSGYPLVEPLTEREREVLRYLATYLPFDRIGTALHISSNTVKTHVRGIYRKLGVQSRAEAVERALSAGLLAYGPIPDITGSGPDQRGSPQRRRTTRAS